MTRAAVPKTLNMFHMLGLPGPGRAASENDVFREAAGDGIARKCREMLSKEPASVQPRIELLAAPATKH